MKLEKIGRRILTCGLITAMWLHSLGTNAFAAEPINPEELSSVAVLMDKDGVGIEDVYFHIYKTADVSVEGEMTLTDDFAGYPVSYQNLDHDGWKILAETLSGYVSRDKVAFLQREKTNANGIAHFQNLVPGLYLVTGEPFTRDGYYYTQAPFLAWLPQGSQEEGWEYDLVADVKYQMKETEEGFQSFTVVKAWDDSGYESLRPDKVIAELLRDGVVYGTGELTKENNWRYTWENLEKDHLWQVVEKDVKDIYTVTSVRDGSAAVITNKLIKRNEPDSTPNRRPSGGGGRPGSNPQGPGTTITDEGVPTSYFNLPDDPVPASGLELIEDEDVPLARLPQTGVLWWPVPILLCVGTVLLYFGLKDQQEMKRMRT